MAYRVKPLLVLALTLAQNIGEIQCAREIIGHPVATTRYGHLRGKRIFSTEDRMYVDAFLNIPYARPPTGRLRFRRPERPDQWSGIRDATQYGAQCPQGGFPVDLPLSATFPNSEDCLYLNIFTPQVPFGTSSLPVMVWIHGGGLFQGTGNSFDGTELAMKGVVLVTINYRLESLGFLSTEDDASPGNYGLWDMIRALEWIKESISDFKGDPNDVTVFGESAGGVAVSLLSETEAAKGLFQKAIMQSGVSLFRYAVALPNVDPKPRELTERLATSVGCETTPTSRMMDCLRSADLAAILNATYEIRSDYLDPPVFRPVVETTFGQRGLFSARPVSLLDDGLFHNITAIRGFTKDEAGSAVSDPEGDGLTLEEFENKTQAFFDAYLKQFSSTVNLDDIYSNLTNLYVYTPNITDPLELRSAFIQMLGDYFAIAPVMYEANVVTKHPEKPQYVYRFSYRSPSSPTPEWQGVIHAGDLAYTFGAPVSNIDTMKMAPNWTDDDRSVSQEMMTMWTNFAKYGDPTPDGFQGAKWLPWMQTTPSVLDIALPSRVRDDLITPEITFWMDTLSTMLNAHSETPLVG